MTDPLRGRGKRGAKFRQRGPYWSTDRDRHGEGLHTGGDLIAPTGTPVYAPVPGRVIAANAYDKAYGYKIIIRFGDRDIWLCHMPKNAAKVKFGDIVHADQLIGAVGATGNVTGSHLHMENRPAGGGFYINQMRDPFLLLDYGTGKPATSTAGKAVSPAVRHRVTTTALNGRGGPGTDYALVGKPAAEGGIITETRRSGVWVMNPEKRWFHSGYLAPAPAPPTPVPAKGPLRLRVGTFNIPDREKIAKDPAGRAKAGAALLNAANLDVVGLQELVGPTGGKPSTWATTVLKALGPGWKLVTPTRAHNENYIAYRPSEVELVRQYADLILPSPHGGRHATIALFRDRTSGELFLFVCTHLVHQKDAGASRAKQANDLGASARAIAKANNGCPVIVVGDMNRSDPLPVLGRQASQGGKLGATFTTYSKSARSTNRDQEYDHIYFTAAGSKLRGYNLLGVDGREFTTPLRPADHVPVIASIEYAA